MSAINLSISIFHKISNYSFNPLAIKRKSVFLQAQTHGNKLLYFCISKPAIETPEDQFWSHRKIKKASRHLQAADT